MISILPLMFCAFSATLATQVTRTHHRGFGSPVPHSYGSPLPHHQGMYILNSLQIRNPYLVDDADWSGHSIETNKWDHDHAPRVKRDEGPATTPTRTHHQSYGSPAPYTKSDPFSSLEGNPEASSLAEDIYQILEEYEKELEETSGLASGLPTDIPSSLIKRSPDSVTGLPDGPDPFTYNFSGPFGPNTADASATRSIAEEEVISSEDPPFIVRRGPAHRRGFTNILSTFLPRKRMEGYSWSGGKSHEGKRVPRDRVNLAPRSKSVDEQ